MKVTRIKSNKARCLNCNETIESTYRHDYVTCKCGNLAVDGGKDYLKRCYATGQEYQDLSVVEEIDIEQDAYLDTDTEIISFAPKAYTSEEIYQIMLLLREENE